MKTLAIDTSTYVMGVAILDGNQLVGEVTTNLKKIIHCDSCLPSSH